MTHNAAPLAPVRRILTAIDAAGRSHIAQDGPSPARIYNEARPGYCNANIWRTVGSPARVDAPDDITLQEGVLPPAGGTVLRVIDFPPQPGDPDERRRQSEAVFATMFKDAQHHAGSQRHPGMHVTQTIDYAIVLHGEIVAIMDEDETLMRAGDILIQRGTHHAWANRSDAMARVAFVLVDARQG